MSAVDLAASQICLIDEPKIEALRLAAQSSPRRRTRYCLHESHDSPVQQMLIALCAGSYIPPHRQNRFGKSYVLFEGSLVVAFFDDDGRLRSRQRMSPNGRNGPSMLRFWSDQWHTTAAASDVAIYLELAAGPYEMRNTHYAPWSPTDGDASARDFLTSLIEN